MRSSTLLQNRIFRVFQSLLIAAVICGCTLNADNSEDSNESSTSGSTASLTTKSVTISVPATVLGSRSAELNSREISTVSIEAVSLTVRIAGTNEVMLRKYPDFFAEQESFVISAELPVNTDLTLEAVGYDSEGEISSYGIREMQISEDGQVAASFSMLIFQPTNLPIVKLTEISAPPAVSANGIIGLEVSGYVTEAEWPADPYGDNIPALNLDFSAVVNSSRTKYYLGTIQLEYADLSAGIISFSNTSLQIPGDAGDTADIVLSSELSPGGTLETTLSVPQMTAANSFSASADPAGGKLDLSWNNPVDSSDQVPAWFDGSVLVYSMSAPPLTVSGGTITREFSTVDSPDYSHTGLTNGQSVHYTLFPFAEEGGVRVYGPAATVSAVPVDSTPPAAVTSFSVSENNGSVSLNWTNPNASSDYERVRVLRRSGAYPSYAYDPYSVCIYDGTGISDTDSLSSAGTYYYSVFVLDGDGNSSGPFNRSVVYYISTGSNANWGYNYGTLSISDRSSVRSSSKYADVYTFTLTSYSTVTIGMDGYYGCPDFDTYLYLYSGSSPAYSSLIASNDDSGYAGYSLNSRITISLSPGVYSIEATHYGLYQTGQYSLYLSRY